MTGVFISSVQSLSHVWLFANPWTSACQPSLSIPTPGTYTNSYSFHQCCHTTVLSSIGPFSSPLQSFPASGSFPISQFLASDSQSIGVSASASVLPMNIQCWLVWSPCSPGDSQESSPTPQLKSISPLALILLYGPSLIFVHGQWQNHSFDYMYICRQSDVSAF